MRSENKERVKKCDNKWSKYDQVVFSKYPDIVSKDERSKNDVYGDNVRTCIGSRNNIVRNVKPYIQDRSD